jgi:hypothetical protein
MLTAFISLWCIELMFYKYAEVSQMSNRLSSESRVYADKARDLNRQVSHFQFLCSMHMILLRPSIFIWTLMHVNLKYISLSISWNIRVYVLSLYGFEAWHFLSAISKYSSLAFPLKYTFFMCQFQFVCQWLILSMIVSLNYSLMGYHLKTFIFYGLLICKNSGTLQFGFTTIAWG